MKQLKPTKQPNPNARHILVPFKVNSEEMREILKRAATLTKSNVSEYLRFAALHFKPSKTDFQK